MKKNTFLIFLFTTIIFWSGGFITPQFINLHHSDISINESDQKNYSQNDLFSMILVNNLLAFNKGAILGFFSLGIYTVYFVLLSGFMFGNMYGQVFQDNAFTNFETVMDIVTETILPYFIPEFIAICISGTIGLYGVILFIRIFNDKEIFNSRKEIYWLLKLLLVMNVLVVLAAYMEAKISI